MVRCRQIVPRWCLSNYIFGTNYGAIKNIVQTPFFDTFILGFNGKVRVVVVIRGKINQRIAMRSVFFFFGRRIYFHSRRQVGAVRTQGSNGGVVSRVFRRWLRRAIRTEKVLRPRVGGVSTSRRT